MGLSFPVYSEQMKEGENHFSNANAYTVKVRKRVKYPFIKDKKGTYSGAGFLIEKKLGWIVTNAHVSSRNPESLDVAFKGGKFIPAADPIEALATSWIMGKPFGFISSSSL